MDLKKTYVSVAGIWPATQPGNRFGSRKKGEIQKTRRPSPGPCRVSAETPMIEPVARILSVWKKRPGMRGMHGQVAHSSDRVEPLSAPHGSIKARCHEHEGPDGGSGADGGDTLGRGCFQRLERESIVLAAFGLERLLRFHPLSSWVRPIRKAQGLIMRQGSNTGFRLIPTRPPRIEGRSNPEYGQENPKASQN